MSATWKVIGVPNVFRELETRAKRLNKKVEKAITDEGNTVLLEAMDQCPVETGTLRRSGTVENPKVKSGDVSVEIGFNTDYALYVHENVNARHEQGKAKFLEDPVNAAAPGLPGRVAARLGRF